MSKTNYESQRVDSHINEAVENKHQQQRQNIAQPMTDDKTKAKQIALEGH